MAPVLEPWSSSTDMICGALSLDLDQYRRIHNILAIPFLEWLQQLQTVTTNTSTGLSLTHSPFLFPRSLSVSLSLSLSSFLSPSLWNVFSGRLGSFLHVLAFLGLQ